MQLAGNGENGTNCKRLVPTSPTVLYHRPVLQMQETGELEQDSSNEQYHCDVQSQMCLALNSLAFAQLGWSDVLTREHNGFRLVAVGVLGCA